MLVRSYGIYWMSDAVEWGSRGRGGEQRRLEGTRREKVVDNRGNRRFVTFQCDFWNDQGIYVLYEGYNLVYIGKAIGTPLGVELGNRRSRGRHAGRWDSFSWFGLGTPVNDPNRRNQPRLRYQAINPPGGRIFEPEDVISDLEALTIMLVDPPLNRRFEGLGRAVEFQQYAAPSRRTILQRIMDVEAGLESLQEEEEEEPED